MTRRIRSINYVRVQEKDEKEIPMSERPIELEISSHRNSQKMITLKLSHSEIAVYGDELIEAVKNAMVETHYVS